MLKGMQGALALLEFLRVRSAGHITSIRCDVVFLRLATASRMHTAGRQQFDDIKSRQRASCI